MGQRGIDATPPSNGSQEATVPLSCPHHFASTGPTGTLSLVLWWPEKRRRRPQDLINMPEIDFQALQQEIQLLKKELKEHRPESVVYA